MDERLPQTLRILRRPEVLRVTGLKQSRLYLLINEGRFPAPVKLGGPKAAGWMEHEVNAWIRECYERSRAEVV